ncbi:MAG: thiamine diphosphokinase [Halanaerobiaceae bacterium]|nr:thiamine diphosphokinase [Halanaerobiaceae bacterium]
MKKEQAVLALNGCLLGTEGEYLDLLGEEEAVFIAADGGVELFETLGLCPDILLGDFDSLSAEKLDYYIDKGVQIIRYPVKKDETDGELAINFCQENGLHEVMIIGSQGGRIDQQIANIFLLEYASKLGLKALIREPGLEIGIARKREIFKNCTGQKLSLIPLSDEVKGISVTGCKYSLLDESLFRWKTRGISNTIVEETAELTVGEGILLYVKTE